MTTKLVANGAYELRSICVTYIDKDGAYLRTGMELHCSRGGSVFARLYWHEAANEPVIRTVEGACMRYEAAVHAVSILPMFELFLMLSEAGLLTSASTELVANCPKIERGAK